MKNTNITNFEEVMPGVKLDSRLVDRLKERIASKNEDKILETVETIKYHMQKIEELKTLLNTLTKVI